MICDYCKNETGIKEYIDKIGYCEKCIKEVWEIISSRVYYNKLFLDCPFCKIQIDITHGILNNCPKCEAIIDKNIYCPHCEDSPDFRRKVLK